MAFDPSLFQPDPLAAFYNQPAADMFTQPGGFEQIAWGAPTSVATTDWLGNPVLPTVPDSAALGMPGGAFVPAAQPMTVYGGGGVGAAWDGAKALGKKALPVIGALSTAKDVYDAGQWLWDRHQQMERQSANSPQWDGPIDNSYNPTGGAPGQPF